MHRLGERSLSIGIRTRKKKILIKITTIITNKTQRHRIIGFVLQLSRARGGWEGGKGGGSAMLLRRVYGPKSRLYRVVLPIENDNKNDGISVGKLRAPVAVQLRLRTTERFTIHIITVCRTIHIMYAC